MALQLFWSLTRSLQGLVYGAFAFRFLCKKAKSNTTERSKQKAVKFQATNGRNFKSYRIRFCRIVERSHRIGDDTNMVMGVISLGRSRSDQKNADKAENS